MSLGLRSREAFGIPSRQISPRISPARVYRSPAFKRAEREPSGSDGSREISDEK